MKRRSASWSISWLLVCGALQAGAVQIDFQASIDRTRSGQADPIQLTLKITADESLTHVPAPKLSLAEFVVEGPVPSTHQQVSIVNSRVQTTFVRELTYTLYPRRTGKITIGSARLKLGGQFYQTRPIEVEIVSGSTRKAPLPGRRSAPGQEASIEDNLFVRVVNDHEQVYVGQQITLKYDLFYRFRLYDVGFKDIPSFSGFWVEELFTAQTLEARQEVVNGLRFNVAPLRQVALFPTSAGVHRVEPLSISCEIPKRSPRRSLFENFGLGHSTQPVVVPSREVQIEVLPLPQEGQPVDFKGAVGKFELQARAQPLELPAGDPVTLKVEIRGQGSLAEIKPPDLDGLQGFKVYEPKLEERERVENGVYGGSRIFEYILIPERGGQLEIPSIRFAFFDPIAAVYRIAQSTPIGIFSRGELEVADAVNGFGLSRKDIREVGQDIRHIKPDLEELEHNRLLYKSGLFWAFQGMMPLALLGLLFYQRHQQRLQGDVAYARRRRAKGEAGKRLRQARQLLQEGKGAEFHAEVQGAVLTFLADQLNLASAGLTGETCAALLEDRGVEAEIIRTVGDLLARCDLARFASMASTQEDMERVQEQAEQIITSLEGLS